LFVNGIAFLCFLIHFLLVFENLVVSTSALDCMKRLVSKMTLMCQTGHKTLHTQSAAVILAVVTNIHRVRKKRPPLNMSK